MAGTRHGFLMCLSLLVCYVDAGVLPNPEETPIRKSSFFNPHQNDQARKGPCCFKRLNALKCQKYQKIQKIPNPHSGSYLFNESNLYSVQLSSV